MANIDKRVVDMKFDNGQFERETSKTLSTLDKLKASLGNLGSSASSINIKTNAAGLHPLSQGVDALVTKFSALQIAGVTAISNIANNAVNAGTQLVNSLTIGPISGGLAEYEKKIGSIQTVLANTESAGTKLKDVTAALDNLNTYSDKTIYNFGEMARNIGTFTAAGVDLKTATGSIKGIANLAALSGSTSEQASTAMYQLSQAISEGKLSLESYNSVVNAGLGGAIFQKAIANTAVAMGTLDAKSVKLDATTKKLTINGKSFRESIMTKPGQKSFVTSEVLTTALKNFTGDMTAADLAAQGFTKSQAAAIIQQAKTASDAATKVKTASQLMNTLKESAESGFAKTFEILIGDFEEAPILFTRINKTIGGLIGASADARNKLLEDFKLKGGRDALIGAFANVFNALKNIIKPISEAFRNIFPTTTGKQLSDMAKNFQNFTKGLILGKENMENLRRTFRGIFAVFGIVTQVIKGAVSAIFSLFPVTQGAGGGFLAITAIIGDFLYGLSRILTFKDPIGKFFDVLVSPLALIKPLVSLVVNLAKAFSSLFSGTTNIDQFFKSIKGSFNIFGKSFDAIGNKVKDFVSGISGGFESLTTYLSGIANKLSAGGNTAAAGFIKGLAKISTFLKNLIQDAQATVGKLIQSFTDASTKSGTFLSNIGGSGLDKLKAAIIAVNDKLVEFREKLNISGNIGKLNDSAGAAASGGVSALSGVMTIAAAIWAGIGSMFTGLGDLIGPFLTSLGSFFTTVITRVKDYIGTMDNQELVAAVNTGVLVLLYVAFKRFIGNMKSTLGDFSNMAKSIGGTFDTLKNSLSALTGAVRASIVMQIAIAVGVLVAALFILAKIDSAALKQALITLGVLFAQMAAIMFVLTKIPLNKLAGAGSAMIAVATAVLILSAALQKLGELDPKVLIQGGLAVASILAAMAGFAKLMTFAPGILAASFAMVIIAGALTLLAGVIVLYSTIPFELMKQGLIGMAATLLVLGLTLQAFPLTAALSALAIAVIAQALIILAGALAIFGALPTQILVKGIGAIAVVLLILAAASAAMTGSILGAIAIGIIAGALTALVPAIALLGALPMDRMMQGLKGLAIIMAIFVVGMTALIPVIAVLGFFATSLLILSGAILIAAGGFYIFVKALGLLAVIGAAGFAVIVAGITTFLAVLPLMIQQAGYAFTVLLKVIRDVAPKFIETVGYIIVKMAEEIARRIPEIAIQGINMIIGLLNAITSRIGDLVNAAYNLVTAFIAAIRARLPLIIQMGLDFILSFIEGLAQAVRGNKERTGAAGADLAKALVEGLASGLGSLGSTIKKAVTDLGSSLITSFKEFFGINSPSTVFSNLGLNIVQGLANGISGAYQLVKDAVTNLAKKLPGPLQKILGIESPSTVFAEFGKYLVQGLSQGLDKNSGIAEKSANNLGDSVMSTMQKSLLALTNISTENMDLAPTITPVFDLTDVKKGSAFIESMLSVNPVAVSTTVTRAADASSGYSANQNLAAISSLQTQRDMQSIAASISAKVFKSKNEPLPPRPVEFHIGTIQDGDSLLQRARATNRMLSLAEGGDSSQLERI